MSSDPKEEEVDESILDEPVEGANLAADEEIDESILDHEMEIDAPSNPPSELHSDAHSEGSPPHSSHEIKEETSNDAQHTDTDEKPKQVSGESTPKKTPTKRARRSRARRNETDDEIDDDEKDEDMESDHKAMLSSADRKINVGDDFQARVEESQKDDQMLPQLSEEEREREYALYILQKSNFDFDVAREKVKKRRLITEEWCEDDRTLFKQAFHMFGKRFDKIRQTMPHRSMASIIQFYYNTKKDTDYKSLFDSRIADDSDEEEGFVSKIIFLY
ncbi:Myb-like DNA-binding domain protein [Ancylostoma ceylanicum]|uniref:Myb-like DNA-binding domain protein n=1 Tax=Ancylostoma ceylanicum TaxID=53326 RepID=A0A0D6LS93_9BILA|nr:Myb-like DNA-binding domain protein [Ancylostoma ceylanicum]